MISTICLIVFCIELKTKKIVVLSSSKCKLIFHKIDDFKFQVFNINLKYFSFLQVDLKHWNQVTGSNIVKVGIDLSEFYLSVEWDILAVPATRNEEYYPCCQEPYSGKSNYQKSYKITILNLKLIY